MGIALTKDFFKPFNRAYKSAAYIKINKWYKFDVNRILGYLEIVSTTNNAFWQLGFNFYLLNIIIHFASNYV